MRVCVCVYMWRILYIWNDAARWCKCKVDNGEWTRMSMYERWWRLSEHTSALPCVHSQAAACAATWLYGHDYGMLWVKFPDGRKVLAGSVECFCRHNPNGMADPRHIWSLWLFTDGEDLFRKFKLFSVFHVLAQSILHLMPHMHIVFVIPTFEWKCCTNDEQFVMPLCGFSLLLLIWSPHNVTFTSYTQSRTREIKGETERLRNIAREFMPFQNQLSAGYMCTPTVYFTLVVVV